MVEQDWEDLGLGFHFVEIRKTGNPFLHREVAGCRKIAISGKIAIFDFPDFFVKKIQKNPEDRFF